MEPFLPQGRMMQLYVFGRTEEIFIGLIHIIWYVLVYARLICTELVFEWEKGPIFAVKFSECGRWIVSASLDGTACVWDVKGKSLYNQYRCHTGKLVLTFLSIKLF